MTAIPICRPTVPTRRTREGVEVLPPRGEWRFTRQGVVAAEHVPPFYDLYLSAFEHLKRRSAARQVLTRSEFFDQMVDPRVEKYIAWSADGAPVGMTTLTRHLDSVPWISPEYFEARYPAQAARHAVYYLGFTLAHPRERHKRFVETMLQVGIEEMVAEGAVIAYDACAYNEAALRFSDRVESVLEDYPSSKLELVDTQSFSCITFG
ncbi:MAG: hypothetical protein JWP61_2985 [Friedmanniella sp.]|nr:hypothetical protein [Friedmanniella sp.]